MGRARISAMQAHHCNSEGALYSLEETLGDKDKQMQQLRDQRDRAEKDKEEERELHEREVTEYKLKLHSLECDIEKLNSRLDRILIEKERVETRLESSQSELGKSKAEYDKVATEVGRSSGDWEATKQRLARLELENERLRHDLERSQVNSKNSPISEIRLECFVVVVVSFKIKKKFNQRKIQTLEVSIHLNHFLDLIKLIENQNQ